MLKEYSVTVEKRKSKHGFLFKWIILRNYHPKGKEKKASDSPIIQISMLVLGLKWGFK